MRCLLTCEGIDVNKHLSVISALLDDFLFPAAKLALSIDSHDSLSDFSPKYVSNSTRVSLVFFVFVCVRVTVSVSESCRLAFQS